MFMYGCGSVILSGGNLVERRAVPASRLPCWSSISAIIRQAEYSWGFFSAACRA